MKTALRLLGLLLAAPLVLALFLVSLAVGLLLLCVHLALGNFRVVKKLSDPAFGVMTYNGGGVWSADHDHVFPALGGSFRVAVAARKATGPSPAQRATLSALVQRQDDIRRQVEAALHRDYQALAPEVRQQLAPLLPPAALDETLPHLRTPADIWPLLTPATVFIDDAPDHISISWNCTWDEEHGVQMSFEQGKLIDER
jgi:hypothetical protein